MTKTQLPAATGGGDLIVPNTDELRPFSPWELIFDGLPVRIIWDNGEPWFVAADVCHVLSLKNWRQVAAALPDDWRTMKGIGGERGRRDILLIAEPGLYQLIFTSRKARAQQFRDWVFGEILPQIRRSGRYDASQGATPGSSGPGEQDNAALDWEDRHQLQTLLPKPIPLRLPDFGLFMVTATPERPPHIRQIPLDEVRETLTSEYFRSECMLLIASLLRIEAFSRRDRLRLGLGDSQTRASSQEVEHAIDEGGALARKIGIQFRTAPDTPAAAA